MKEQIARFDGQPELSGSAVMPRTCGGCTLCCKLLGVRSLEKPKYSWCKHCDVGRGCKIYTGRPDDCRAFKCTWLLNDFMPEELRPDRCKVVFEGLKEAELIIALVDNGRPDAWKAPLVAAFMNAMVQQLNVAFIITTGSRSLECLLPRGRTVDSVQADLLNTPVAKDLVAKRETTLVPVVENEH